MKRRVRIGRMFHSAPSDEVMLFREARKLGDVDTKEKLREVHQQKGVSIATAFLYLQLLKKHNEFIADIDAIDPENPPQLHSTPVKILIVPGMFYGEHEEIGADGALVKEIASQYGITTELIPLKSRGSVRENVLLLREAIESEKHEHVWIVSFSKGSTEVRICLEEMGSEGFPSNIKGWINISGMPKGTLHADKKLKSTSSRMIWKLTKLILGVDLRVTEEIATTNELLSPPMTQQEDFTIIHVVGVPLPSHVNTPLYKRYELLESHGPNDGIVMLDEFIELPGYVYPIWGADHFLRPPGMSDLIHRLCIFILLR